MLNNAKEVMKTLISQGYEAYLVGGCVRDHLLGVNPKDYDITTNAHPDEVEGLFEKTIPTGKKFGTITVMMDNIPYEITTYRKDLEYLDERRPSVVEFAKTLREDLSRRDFTVNAMAMDIDGNIIDYFGGKSDLEYLELNTVGSPEDRFSEDKLRILRMFRFSAKYGFTPHRSLYGAIQHEREDVDWLEMKTLDITKLSSERIRDEFNKIIVCDNPSSVVRSMYSLGVIQQFIPELRECYKFNQNNIHHSKDVFEHIMDVLDSTEPNLYLRLSALFHDIGKPRTYTEDINGGHFYSHHKESSRMCRDIMTRLKYSNHEIEYVSELVYHHMTRYERLRTSNVKKFINKVGTDKLNDLFKLFVADRSSSNPPYDFEDIYKLKFECERVLNEKEPLSVKDLEINGYHVMKLGYKGKEVGEKLQLAMEHVLEDKDNNIKEKLIECIGKKHALKD